MNRAKCSVKLLELLAAGLPVVASRVGQAREYIAHGESGLLVEPGGVPLGLGALDLLNDPARRQALGRAAAAAMAYRWSWSRLAERAERAYAAALAPR
jgi:glycosyltransferase involved in cell wall biosynthesis